MSQILHFQRPNSKIPQRIILAPEDYLQQRIQIRYGFPNFRAPSSYGHANGSQATEAVLLKYYPKYCRFLRFDERKKRWSVLSRIRQIKTVEKFLYDFGWIRSFERKEIIIKKIKSLFKNKRKSIRSLPIINSGSIGDFQKISEKTIMDLCPFFPRIHTLKVFPPGLFHNQLKNGPASRDFEGEVSKSYGYFWRTLKYIQHLEISTSSTDIWVILPQLQSSKNFLSSLKTFCLEVSPICLHANERKACPRFLFQTLLKNQGLLHYVTHLKFAEFEDFHLYGNQVKSILDCCPNLIFLSFPIGPGFYWNNLEFSKPKPHLTLAPLQSLQNVTILTLKVDGLWSFIEAFEFPLQLRKLTFHLYDQRSWRDAWADLYPLIYDDPSDEIAFQSYEKYNVLLNFFERFKQLTNLTTLDLNMPLFTQANEVMNNFILPLMRSIPRLENFECQLYQERLEVTNYFDMSIFLHGIAPLQQLKSFKIFQRLRGPRSSIHPGDLIVTFDPIKSYSFPNIASFYIDTWIHENFNFKKFFKMFSTRLKEVTLSKVHLTSIHSFTLLLRHLCHLEQIPSTRVNITITLLLKILSDLEFLTYPFIPPKNLFLTTNIYISCEKLCVLDPTDVDTIQKALSNLKVNITLLVPDGWGKKHIPIMKNNIPYDTNTAGNSAIYDKEWDPSFSEMP